MHQYSAKQSSVKVKEGMEKNYEDRVIQQLIEANDKDAAVGELGFQELEKVLYRLEDEKYKDLREFGLRELFKVIESPEDKKYKDLSDHEFAWVSR